MKILMTICLTLLTAKLGIINTNAEPQRADINPALLYFQASQTAPDLSDADRKFLFEPADKWLGQQMPSRCGELLSRFDTEFTLIGQAAHATLVCDWGVDWTKGPETLLPHLSRCRAVAQVARLRVMWSLQNGRSKSAVDDLATSFALARNSSRDGSLIAVLVETSMENILSGAVAENFDRFSHDDLSKLEQVFGGTIPQRKVADCISIERSSFPDWMIARIGKLQKEHAGDDAKVLDGIRKYFEGTGDYENGQDTKRWQRISAAAGGTSAGLVKIINDAAAMYPRLAQILALQRSEYEVEMNKFNAEITASTNPMVGECFGSWARARTREYANLTQLAMVRWAIAYKLHRKGELEKISDPCASTPFEFERFSAEGVDRGFKLSGSYDGRGFRETMIFAEKSGAPIQVSGRNAGKPVINAAAGR